MHVVADGARVQVVLVAAGVAAVRASAALKRWVAQVHAERCAPAAQRAWQEIPSAVPGRFIASAASHQRAYKEYWPCHARPCCLPVLVRCGERSA